jgi:hypothetical protein
MHIHEPHNRVDVTTPKGDGVIWLVTEYGHETDTLYTIILNNGKIWQFTHKDIVVKDNLSFNRKSQPIGIGGTGITSGNATYVCPEFIPETKFISKNCLRCGKLESEHPQKISAFDL